jgi:DNA polymerase alpha subunit A
MNFARTGVTESKRKTIVVKEASKDNEMDIDSIMDNKITANMEVGAKPGRGRNNVQKTVTKRAPVVARSKQQSYMPDIDSHLDDYYGGGNDDNDYGDDTYYDNSTSGNIKTENGMDVVSGNSNTASSTKQTININKTSRKLNVNFDDVKGGTTNDEFKPVNEGLDNTSMSSSISGGGAAALENAAPIDSKLWLQKPENQDEFLNFYYLDATEMNGVVYLFGKVEVTDNTIIKNEKGSQSTTQIQRKYVSCCVAVHNCERNLFVLPKATGEYHKDGSAKRAEFQDVYGEISKLLIPNYIPKKAGLGFKCAKKVRNYAFEHTTVPRCPTEYLKVKYSAKFKTPSINQCSGGQHYERIFGAETSVLELFLLKRRLMGPCWLKISKPRLMPEKISWCKLEVGVEDPKTIIVHPDNKLSVPPLVSLSVSMKTAVNPHTHTHEVIAISGWIHTQIQADVDTEIKAEHMRRFTYIRPLGMSCGSQHPDKFPHDIQDTIKKSNLNGILETFPNERSMLSKFFNRIQLEDPDILASHNLFGFEFDVLLNRAVQNKIPLWDRLGRLRKAKPPKSISDSNGISGRIFCDTYKAAKEFLRETTYSLTHLAGSQLKTTRVEVDPVDVPKYFQNSNDILILCRRTEIDAWLVQSLTLKLQVIPLTKQLTNLSGNTWSRTMKGARAERIEYLLLHNFHKEKYILPEKKPFESKVKAAVNANDDEDDDGAGNNKVGGFQHKRGKSAYQGGLVLEPKKGLYDTFILLLDFNSLYPSLIQEYNLCFTTVDYTKYMPDANGKIAGTDAGNGLKKVKVLNEDEEDDDDDEADGTAAGANLPPIPEQVIDPDTKKPKIGILPRVIKFLVDRRKVVKTLLKNERDPVKRQEHDIRQKALKLTANSMYGCLGFSFSRFYARPIAALVTAKGREALQRTVDVATNGLQLDVIYGDTDSVMINTNSRELKQVKELGRTVCTEVNKLYKSLELDVDGVFASMLLLKKKKYAALTIDERDGKIIYEKELKGLDLVRRDWAPISKNTGKWVVDTILKPGSERENIVLAIHDHLSDLATKIRSGDMDLKEFIVTKGLNKNPKDYPDVKGQPHLQVALKMLAENRPVNIGDHIPYVICKEGPEGSTPPQRAHHPDEVFRSNGSLTIDYEWYLTNQILPPISRLCEPIDGTSQVAISEKLGLDSSKFRSTTSNDNEFDDWDYKPMHMRDDSERFRDVDILTYDCTSCLQRGLEYPGPFGGSNGHNSTGISCVACGALYLGRNSEQDCFSYLCNRVTIQVRECTKKYYNFETVCDNSYCRQKTRQQSLRGDVCMSDNCRGQGGHLVPEYDGNKLHTQLKYLESLFDFERASEKIIRNKKAQDTGSREDQVVITELDKNEFKKSHNVPTNHQEIMRLIKTHMGNSIKWSGYNWIEPSLWTNIFKKVLVNGNGNNNR